MVTKNQIKVLTTNMWVKIEKTTSLPHPLPPLQETWRGGSGKTLTIIGSTIQRSDIKLKRWVAVAILSLTNKIGYNFFGFGAGVLQIAVDYNMVE